MGWLGQGREAASAYGASLPRGLGRNSVPIGGAACGEKCEVFLGFVRRGLAGREGLITRRWAGEEVCGDV